MASIRCAHCKGRHASVTQVKACATPQAGKVAPEPVTIDPVTQVAYATPSATAILECDCAMFGNVPAIVEAIGMGAEVCEVCVEAAEAHYAY